MITAIMLLQTERIKVNSIAEKLTDIKGVNEVYSVSGRYDLIAIVRVKNIEGVSEIVTNHILKVEGIIKSETLVSFRVFSPHDLDGMFGDMD